MTIRWINNHAWLLVDRYEDAPRDRVFPFPARPLRDDWRSLRLPDGLPDGHVCACRNCKPMRFAFREDFTRRPGYFSAKEPHRFRGKVLRDGVEVDGVSECYAGVDGWVIFYVGPPRHLCLSCGCGACEDVAYGDVQVSADLGAMKQRQRHRTWIDVQAAYEKERR